MAVLRSRKWIIWSVVALILCGGGTYAYVKAKSTKGKAKDPQDKVVAVQVGDIRSTVSGTSQFEPRDVQNVIAPTDGTIKTMNLTRNQEVKAGDLLFEISDPSLDAALQQAQSNLRQQEKDLNDLLAQQSGLRITAPAGGVFTVAGNLDVGSNAAKGAKIGTVSDSSLLTVQLAFPAAAAVQLSKGDLVELTVTNYMLTKSGTVDYVDKTMKGDARGNKLLNVNIQVPNDGTLSGGMKVKGELSIGGAKVSSAEEAALDYISSKTIVSEAQGTIEQWNENAKNGKSIHSGDLIAVIRNDSLQDNITNKQADIERQRIIVADAQGKVNELKVTAPFDGAFSTDFANQKSNVLASFPVGAKIEQGKQLGAVANLTNMQLPIQVDELDLPNIKAGQKAQITVDALPGRSFEGEVTQVSTVGTTTNGVTSYSVVLSVKNTPQNDLKNGMTATALILVKEKKNALLLPTQAVQMQRGKRTVTLQKADGTTEQKEVKIGLRSQTQVEITEGLQEGDKVILQNTPQRSGNLTQNQIDQIRNQYQGGAGGFGNNGGGAQGGAQGGNVQGGGAQGGNNGGNQGGGGNNNRARTGN